MGEVSVISLVDSCTFIYQTQPQRTVFRDEGRPCLENALSNDSNALDFLGQQQKFDEFLVPLLCARERAV